MYIKSIVLDGFKSYGNRVEITGFDPEFNAITGLNGTGKSNILDSICFVLGITNLSNVRAGSLQELIYKHGQAGITKATVSITFDNKDKRHCPIGYENHDEITVTRQVVMGGKNKYLINGINVQNKRVSDLFCSVQLNVNNPHFLIMQGRITKVLNMKPPEILSMVEEAAGTRMYEAKKQAAEKTIEKKDAKLRELDDIIKEDIAPKLQKLQDERAQFQEYQKVVREYENLSRLYIAWKYVTEQENAKEAESKVTEVQDEIKSKKDTIKENEVQAKEFDKEITKLNKKMDKESGNTLKQLEGDLGEAEQKEAKVAAEARAARDALATHDKRARLLHRALADDRRALAACRARLEGVSESFEQLRTSREAQQVALDEAQKHFLAVSSGLDSGSGSLHDQFIAAKQEASEASTCMSQCDMERRHAEARLKELEREFKSSSAQYERDQRTIASHEQQLAQLEAELSAMNFSEERYSELSEQVRAMQRAARGRRERAEALGARLQRCDFHYSDPEPGFDRSRVLGTICRLIDVCDPKYFTAIETAAGGRLYNVVVDTEQTSKLLLQRGQLRARTTIIPLNKISPSVVPPDVVRAAQDIGGGADKVRLALELVRFPARARAAVAWVLGGTLACADLDAARRATFDPRVRRRCVTLDGDVCDPAGTLSGGARHQGESVLQQLQQLKQLEAELQRDEEQLAAASAELEGMHQMADRYAAAKQKHETMRQEVEMTRLRVGSTRHAQAHAEMAALRDQLAALAERRARAARAQAEAGARAASLEGQLQDLQGHRDREFKKAEQALKKAKAECEQHGSEWKQREQEYEMLRLELQELEETVGGAERQLADSGAAGDRLRAALHAAADDYAKAAEEVKEIQARIKQYKAEIAEQNGSIARLVQKKEQLATANSELELQIKELEYKVKELQTEATECTKKIASLESEHPWISAEREYFGAAGGAYDFARQPGGASGASVAGARLAQLRERRERLSRGLNARAHALLGREEEQYADVLRKRAIVEADRAKLVQVIAELDERKRHTLRGACEQVNRDFGSIFGALLPGAQAQLAAAGAGAGAGTGSVLDGLEIRVGFNGAWKEALGELSGGQRSLVALSLVLALLLFKPAPLYILDEVDAALDLSHTQNIGQMLKDHFRHSQFIIVSLKDGMFNNANVLFRTRFVDGMSSVQRVSNARR